MRRFFCICQYDGTDFSGWQSQVTKNTIQDYIENRLFEILKVRTRIHGSGRTDAGVHARAQVFHFDADWKYGKEKMLVVLRNGLPPSIRISKVSELKKRLHARYDAKGKRYVYYIYEGDAPPDLTRYRWSIGYRKLDIEKMNETAKYLIGKHDFTAFSLSRGVENDDPMKDMRILKISKRGREIRITTEASGYMYKMVRAIVGVLVDVGSGKKSPNEVKQMLDLKRRIHNYKIAPAKGLFLEKVYY